MPTPPTNTDGSLRPYTTDEIAAFGIKWRGVRDGTTPTISLEVNANRGEATCFVDPTQINDAICYFLGASLVYDSSGTKKISRLLPFRLPGREGLVVTKITKINGFHFTGKVPDANWPQYGAAEVGLLFESPRYKIQTDTLTVKEIDRYVDEEPGESTSEVISVWGSNLKLVRDPSKPNPTALPHGEPIPTNNVFKTVIQQTFQTTQWRVPERMVAPDSPWFTRVYGTGEQYDVPLLGAINKAVFLGRPVGTVLLKNVKLVKDVSPLGDGTFEYRVVATWEFKPSGWNWIWFANTQFPDVNDFYMCSSSGVFNTADTVPPRDSLYSAADLNKLFEP